MFRVSLYLDLWLLELVKTVGEFLDVCVSRLCFVFVHVANVLEALGPSHFVCEHIFCFALPQT